MDFQHSLAVGRATSDATIIESKSGKNFSTVSIAINTYIKDKDTQVDYVDVLVFGPQADRFAEKVKKGSGVFLQGKMVPDAYINKDGEPVGKLKLLVDKWDLIK